MSKDIELDVVGRQPYPCGLTGHAVPKQSILKLKQVPALILRFTDKIVSPELTKPAADCRPANSSVDLQLQNPLSLEFDALAAVTHRSLPMRADLSVADSPCTLLL